MSPALWRSFWFSTNLTITVHIEALKSIGCREDKLLAVQYLAIDRATLRCWYSTIRHIKEYLNAESAYVTRQEPIGNSLDCVCVQEDSQPCSGPSSRIPLWGFGDHAEGIRWADVHMIYGGVASLNHMPRSGFLLLFAIILVLTQNGTHQYQRML
jgi:hypothetical protein